MTASLNDARAFLAMLGDSTYTFQTFADSATAERGLVRILHGTLVEHAKVLSELNAWGAGVFVMVNAGDGKGRKSENVRRVRALFVDLDGSPLDPVLGGPLKPHCVVESSPGRWHAYWLVAGVPLDAFKATQQALAARLGGDPKVCDLARVMRLPGFDHRKGSAFRTRIHAMNAQAATYDYRAFVTAFGITTTPEPIATRSRRKLPDQIKKGERNATLLSCAASFVRRGHDPAEVNHRLQVINAARCVPPLCATEVDAIATQAANYGSAGFVQIPHKLLDSPEWKALRSVAHDVILMAMRRYDGSNNGRIALTAKDFPQLSAATFCAHRAAAVRSGILIRVSKSRNSRDGRKPALYAIDPKWLNEGAQLQKSNMGPTSKTSHLHIQTSSRDLEPWDADGATETNAEAA